MILTTFSINTYFKNLISWEAGKIRTLSQMWNPLNFSEKVSMLAKLGLHFNTCSSTGYIEYGCGFALHCIVGDGPSIYAFLH